MSQGSLAKDEAEAFPGEPRHGDVRAAKTGSDEQGVVRPLLVANQDFVLRQLETEQLTGRFVVLVTNRVDWSAAKIITMYWQRWPTEIV